MRNNSMLNDMSISSQNTIQRKNRNLAKVKGLHPDFILLMNDLEVEIESGTLEGEQIEKLLGMFE
jgi:hypothetical protein